MDGDRKQAFLRHRLNLIAEDVGDHGAHLFVGDRYAASDVELLAEHGITAVLNCAYDLDVNYVAEHAGGTIVGEETVSYGHAPLRVAKVGLIDGPGNPPALLEAACHMLEGMLHQALPGGPHYPEHERGNILVHCQAGMSRSVTVTALYLHHRHRDRWPDFEGAVDHVRQSRQFFPEEYEIAPTQGMRDLAATLHRQLKRDRRRLFETGR